MLSVYQSNTLLAQPLRLNSSSSCEQVMKKNSAILLFICFAAGVGIVLALYYKEAKRLATPNGFSRRLTSSLPKIKKIDLKYPHYYIAGFDSLTLYLGSYAAPALINRLDLRDLTLIQQRIEQAETLPVNWRQSTLDIRPPFLYLMDGATPNILFSRLSSVQPIPINEWRHGFYHAIPVSETSFIVCDYDTLLQTRTLNKIAEGAKQKTIPPILQKQYDGIFCTDGRLYANQTAKDIIYLYYYRNQFICMDSALRIKYTANAIDTNSMAKIKLEESQQGTATTFGAPPRIVNRAGCLTEDIFYILSNLRADNEIPDQFRENCVIDRYDLKTGRYLSSFYLPRINNKCLNSFIVSGKLLIALYEQDLQVFELGAEDGAPAHQ